MNRYLGRLAGTPSSLTSKIGIGVSTAALGVSLNNSASTRTSADIDKKRIQLERDQIALQEQQRNYDQRQLKALNSIHKALTVTPNVKDNRI